MKKLVFMHMPRCGGSVISALLSYHWEKAGYYYSFPTWGPHIKEWMDAHPNWKGIGGHFIYRNYDEYIKEPYIQITTLRDPVDRVLSHYEFIKVQKDHPLSEDANKMSIEEIYDKGLGKYMQMSDEMVKFLCNGDYNVEYAKSNLDKDYILFGLQERLQEFAAILRALLNFSDEGELEFKPHTGRLPLSETPPHIIKIVEENNILDREIYEYAKKLYFSKIYKEQDIGE